MDWKEKEGDREEVNWKRGKTRLDWGVRAGSITYGERTWKRAYWDGIDFCHISL